MHFKTFIRLTTTVSLLAAVGALLCVVPASASEKPLDVITTTPNLAALVKTIGNDAVHVRSLARPGEDPHFVEARPSFVRLLHSADLLVVIGLDLGIGYLPALLRQARNPRIQPGGAGYFNASEGVNTILPPNAGIMARAMGDVHPRGNPHYLTDPVEGLRVTRRLVEKLSQLAPQQRSSFEKNYLTFRDELLTKLYGSTAVNKLGAQQLAIASFVGPDATRELFASGKLSPGGWEGELQPLSGTPFVADHDLWPYFARRFNLRQIALLEPFAGVAPTARHLQEVIGQMRQEDVQLILSSSYFRDQYAKKVASETGAGIAVMVDQVGLVEEASTSYLDMIQVNLDRVRKALKP